MPSKTVLTSEQVVTLLQETPLRIGALTRRLAPAQLQTRTKHDEWSANDVLAHLRACADVWGGCIVEIITQDTPTLRAINPTTWIKHTDYRELDFEPSLHAFAAQRTRLLAVLEPLAHAGWSRSATVTGAGRVLERTVLFYARWLAGHERQHHTQFARMVKTLR